MKQALGSFNFQNYGMLWSSETDTTVYHIQVWTVVRIVILSIENPLIQSPINIFQGRIPHMLIFFTCDTFSRVLCINGFSY